MDEINVHFASFTPAKLVAEKLNQPISTVISIYLMLAFLLSLSHTLGYFAVALTGVLYPGYMSIMFINKKDKVRDKEWLSYWVLFGLNNFVDYLLAPVILIIPFYYSSRLLFTIYLFWPTTKGSLVLYELLEDKLKFNENLKKVPLKSKSMKED